MVESLGELGTLAIFVRLVLAAILGGVIGIERGRKRRPAGFRTYMLVCIGAALVMITNEYIALRYTLADPARLGAQVISGIGFLGAGTIIVTRHNQVIGLTTAAGLWASACMGLAIGVGFYTGAIMACVFILLAVTLLQRLELHVVAHARLIDLHLGFKGPAELSAFLSWLREEDYKVDNLQTLKARGTEGAMAATMTIRLPVRTEHALLIEKIAARDGIVFVEEA